MAAVANGDLTQRIEIKKKNEWKIGNPSREGSSEGISIVALF